MQVLSGAWGNWCGSIPTGESDTQNPQNSSGDHSSSHGFHRGGIPNQQWSTYIYFHIVADPLQVMLSNLIAST